MLIAADNKTRFEAEWLKYTEVCAPLLFLLLFILITNIFLNANMANKMEMRNACTHMSCQLETHKIFLFFFFLFFMRNTQIQQQRNQHEPSQKQKLNTQAGQKEWGNITYMEERGKRTRVLSAGRSKVSDDSQCKWLPAIIME